MHSNNCNAGAVRRAWLVMMACGLAATAQAQVTYEWTGLGDGQSFGDPANWTPQGVPGALDEAKFDTVGPDLVTLAQSREVALTSIENHSVALEAGSFNYSTNGLIVGERSGDFGSLDLSTGTVTTSTDLAIVGKLVGSEGLLTVRGGALLACTEDLLIGDAGVGSMIVEPGAAVTTPLLFIGDENGSVGSVTVRGLVTVSTAALFGNGGTGTVDILGGGRINCNTSFKVGDNAGGDGVVTVTGANSVLSAAAPSSIGNLSDGSVTVSAGGSVITAGLTVGDEGAGELIVNGSASSVVDSVRVRLGNADTSSGLLRLQNGGRVEAPLIEIGDFGFVEGTGVLNGAVVNDGDISPGLPIGTLEVAGSYQQPGDLSIQLGGVDPGSGYDQLRVSGAATLGGILRVELVNGFNPTSGEFVLVDAGSVSGLFNGVVLPPNFSIRYESTRVVISIGGSCVADFNGDGNVDTRDVLSFLNAWTTGDSSADINGDGSVDTRDVLAFLNLWTAGC